MPEGLRDRPGLDAVWSILATFIVMALVTLLGYVSRYVFGKFFFSVGDRFIQSIPGVNAVYNTVRQIVNTFSSQSGHMFNKVVLVEFPRKGCWTIGFLTNTVQGEAQRKAGLEVWTVFVPTTPNPTSGFLLMIRGRRHRAGHGGRRRDEDDHLGRGRGPAVARPGTRKAPRGKVAPKRPTPVPGQTLTADAFVIEKRPPTDAFQGFGLFSAEHGNLLALQRIPKRASSPHVVPDLFDEVSALLESSNQGRTWFVKDLRISTRRTSIGRSYDALRFASALAAIISRNPVHEESRENVALLSRTAFDAFAASERPDVVHLRACTSSPATRATPSSRSGSPRSAKGTKPWRRAPQPPGRRAERGAGRGRKAKAEPRGLPRGQHRDRDPVRFDLDRRRVELGVGDLSDFSIGPQGSGGGGGGIWRAQLGTRWHNELRAQAVADGADALFEVSVTGELARRGWVIALSGRIDQVVREGKGLRLREIKTVTRPLPAGEAELRADYPGYFVQLATYAALRGAGEGCELVFVEADSGLAQTVVAKRDRQPAARGEAVPGDRIPGLEAPGARAPEGP